MSIKREIGPGSGDSALAHHTSAKGWPGCLQAVAAVSLLVLNTKKFVLNWPLTAYTPCDLGEILNSKESLL
jgi:hypothetical protein